jgi:hypothetical protein
MASSGMLRLVVLVRTDVSEELSAPIIRVTRIGELGTLAVTSNRRSLRRLLATANVVPSLPILVTLMMGALRSSETFVLTRATRRNIPEGTILHSHRRQNLKSYTTLLQFTTNNTKLCSCAKRVSDINQHLADSLCNCRVLHGLRTLPRDELLQFSGVWRRVMRQIGTSHCEDHRPRNVAVAVASETLIAVYSTTGHALS